MKSLRHLPEELAILILENLSPASAIRFQSVCKSWHSIVSGPGFLQRNILLPSKSRETSLLITDGRRWDNVGVLIEPSYTVLESPTSLLPKSRPLPSYPESAVVVGSCRGIVCLVDFISGRCVLWNPTTGSSRTLPDNQLGVNDCCFCNIGFGHYDGDFKVIKIFKTRRIEPPFWLRVQIYDLSLDSWREVIPTGTDIKIIGSSCYANPDLRCWIDGKMCSWLAYDWANRDNRTLGYIIISFDMANETFTNFRSVPVPYGGDGIGLLALNDLLALWYCHRHPGVDRTVDIWVMLEHHVMESWTKLWTVRVGPEPHRALQIWKGGLVMNKDSDEHLMWCDLSNSPLFIQALPVFFSPKFSWMLISGVVAIEKTHALDVK